jgi:hypothetical protein
MREFDRYRKIAGDEYRRKMELDEDRGNEHLQTSTLGLFLKPEEFEDRIRAVTPGLVRQAMEEYRPGMKTAIIYPMLDVVRSRRLSKDEALARRKAAKA